MDEHGAAILEQACTNFKEEDFKKIDITIPAVQFQPERPLVLAPAPHPSAEVLSPQAPPPQVMIDLVPAPAPAPASAPLAAGRNQVGGADSLDIAGIGCWEGFGVITNEIYGHWLVIWRQVCGRVAVERDSVGIAGDHNLKYTKWRTPYRLQRETIARVSIIVNCRTVV